MTPGDGRGIMRSACGLRHFTAGNGTDARGEGSNKQRFLACVRAAPRGVHLWTNGEWNASRADLALAARLPRAAANHGGFNRERSLRSVAVARTATCRQAFGPSATKWGPVA